MLSLLLVWSSSSNTVTDERAFLCRDRTRRRLGTPRQVMDQESESVAASDLPVRAMRVGVGRHGGDAGVRGRVVSACLVPGCERERVEKGLCGPHAREGASVAKSEECPHCGRLCGAGPGLASHIRSMHADKIDVPREPKPSGPNGSGIVWEEPPALGRRNAIESLIAGALIELRNAPNKWARVHTFPKLSAGSSAAVRLRKLPEFADIEWRGGVHGDGSALWARCDPSRAS